MSVFDYIEKELERIEVGYTSYDGTRLTMSIDDVRELIENLRTKLAQNLSNACTDTIYRQTAIDAVKKNTFRLTFAEKQNCEGHVAWSAEAVYSDVMEGALLELPSAEPKRGKWEIINLRAVGAFDSCSECKRVVKHKAPFYNYCPNCGADMRDEQDE